MGNSQTHETTTDEKIINETTDKEKIINETTDKILVEIQTNIDNKEYKDWEWEVLKSKFWDAFSKINEEGKQMEMEKMEKIAEDLVKKEIISENEFNSKTREITESRKRKLEELSPTKEVESDLKKLKIEDGGKKRKSKKNKKSKSKSKRKNKKKLKGLNLI